MKHQIVLTIDCEDERFCGECKGTDSQNDWCDLRGEDGFEEDGPYMRGPKCLAAEKKLRGLVEAGEGMRHEPLIWNNAALWDAALAAIKEEK